jgi:hypothetical protein
MSDLVKKFWFSAGVLFQHLKDYWKETVRDKCTQEDQKEIDSKFDQIENNCSLSDYSHLDFRREIEAIDDEIFKLRRKQLITCVTKRN